jgi:hypothetical protein
MAKFMDKSIAALRPNTERIERWANARESPSEQFGVPMPRPTARYC